MGRAGALGLAGGPAAGDSIAMDVLDEDEEEEAIMATEGEDELGPPPLLLEAVGAGLARQSSEACGAVHSGDGGGSRTAEGGTAGVCCVGDCTAGRDLWSGTCGGESPLLRLILGKSQGRS